MAPTPPEPTTNARVQPRPAGGKSEALPSNLNRVGQRGELGATVLGRATDRKRGKPRGLRPSPPFRRPGRDPGLGFLVVHAKTRRREESSARGEAGGSRRDAEERGGAQGKTPLLLAPSARPHKCLFRSETVSDRVLQPELALRC
jgi:hypothetical protein